MDAASAINALQTQKQRGLGLASGPSGDSTAREIWYNTTRAILAAAFGADSRNIGAVLSAGLHRGQMYFEGTPESVIEAHARENLAAAAAMLDSCIEQLQLIVPPIPSDVAEERRPHQETGTLIFIVHGRDEGKKEAVARFLRPWTCSRSSFMNNLTKAER
jgi:hypothetical protein